MAFGEKIKEMRQKKKMTVYDLADGIGKTPGYISRIEARGEIPSPEIIPILADVLGGNTEELFRIAKENKTEQVTQTVAKKFDNALSLYRKGKSTRK